MESPTSIDPVIGIQYPVPYLWFFILTLIAISIFLAIDQVSNLSSIQSDWAEYRCQPHIMPFAGLFGHDVNENFQFCIQQIIQDKTTGVAAPFAQGMSGFTGILGNLMNSANSFRVMLATLVGGVIKIISEFKARMDALMGRVKLTASRMRAMMYRIYGTMFAVMYMGLSAMTGIANLGDSFIFSFIDTFCFPPEQIVTIQVGVHRQLVPIYTVKVGDILVGSDSGTHRVESTYMFVADGQQMVKLGNVTVSSNHFVQNGKRWIMAKDHPDAVSVSPWSGGPQRPLICLTTHDHVLPIEDYVFSDYDETDAANQATQEWVGRSLNGYKLIKQRSTLERCISYEVGSPVSTRVKVVDGYKTLRDVKLGDRINQSAKVVGIQISEIYEYCCLPDGQKIAKGALLWSPLKGEWVRAYTMYKDYTHDTPLQTIALFVSPGAQYELEGGYIVRDAMEIYSPDTKKAYADILLKAQLE